MVIEVNTCVHPSYQIRRSGASCRSKELGANNGIWVQVKIQVGDMLK